LAIDGVTQQKVAASASSHEGDVPTSTSLSNADPALAPVSTDLNNPFDLSAEPCQADSMPALPQDSRGKCIEDAKKIEP